VLSGTTGDETGGTERAFVWFMQRAPCRKDREPRAEREHGNATIAPSLFGAHVRVMLGPSCCGRVASDSAPAREVS
jgi:hypothetical protein